MNKQLRVFFTILFLGALAVLPLRAEDGAVETLRRDLSAIFSDKRLADAQWGVSVYSLDRDESLFQQNAGKLYIPASNAKIITAAAALLRLGPEYRFKTRVMTDGVIEDGILRGNLIIEGFGDPSNPLRAGGKDPFAVFRKWAAQLKAKGIQTIAGDLVGDASSFSGAPYGLGWEWDDLIEGYAAPVSALQFNENILALKVRPGAETGANAVLSMEPLPDYLRARNDATTGSRNDTAVIAVERDFTGEQTAAAARDEIRVSGTLALQGPAVNRSISVNAPVIYYLSALKYALAKEGIDTSTCEVRESSVPPDAEMLWTHLSPPLAELLAPMMKQSLNLMSETFLRVLGLEAHGLGTAANGKAVVEKILSEKGIGKGSYVFADASGLSRRNLASADMFVRILTFMRRQSFFPQFYSALAVAGVDGTLKSRLVGTAAAGNVHAKTGTISSASAISGYVTTADGEMLAFSMIANNFPVSARIAGEVQNRALERLAGFSRKPKPSPKGARP